MGILLILVQSIPIAFDVVFSAATLFTLLYALTRLTFRLVPRLGRYEYRIVLICGVFSVPLVFTVAGQCLTALFYQMQPWQHDIALSVAIYLLVTIWASVSAVLFFRIVKECWRIGWWTKRLPEVDDPAFRLALQSVPVGRGVVLKESGDGGVVASWGLWRRVVLVPDGFVRDYSDEERRLIYLHELSHLRRRDFWMLLLAAALRSAGWFTPAGRWALGRIQEGMEIACDRAVLACKDVSGMRYAELILRAQAAQAALAPGFACRRKTEVRARIEGIVGAGSGSRLRFRDGVAFLAFAVFLTGIGLIGYGIDRDYRRELAESMFATKADEVRVVTMPDGSIATHSLVFMWRGSFGGYAFGRSERIAAEDDGEAAE